MQHTTFNFGPGQPASSPQCNLIFTIERTGKHAVKVSGYCPHKMAAGDLIEYLWGPDGGTKVFFKIETLERWENFTYIQRELNPAGSQYNFRAQCSVIFHPVHA